MPTHHRPTCFQDKPLHQFEYTSIYKHQLCTHTSWIEQFPQSSRPRAAATPLVSWCLWRRWDSNPRPSECKSDALAKLSYNPKFSHTIAGLSAPKRLIKTMSRKHPKSQQPICTSLGFFFPTSGCECVWNRIRTYGAAKPHGRLTACCLKPLGHPNILAGRVGFEPTTCGLTVRCTNRCAISQYKKMLCWRRESLAHFSPN